MKFGQSELKAQLSESTTSDILIMALIAANPNLQEMIKGINAPDSNSSDDDSD